MRPWYAANARTLLEARQKGMVPTGPVVVSLIGGTFGDCAATALYVHADMPAERLDWRMLVNLEAWIWADASIPLERILLLADRIAKVRPRRLVLRFDRPFSHTWDDCEKERTASFDTHDVDIGSGYHTHAIADVPALHSFYWLPIAMNATPIERQLRAALTRVHQPGTLL
jgi:hypothetical protein